MTRKHPSIILQSLALALFVLLASPTLRALPQSVLLAIHFDVGPEAALSKVCIGRDSTLVLPEGAELLCAGAGTRQLDIRLSFDVPGTKVPVTINGVTLDQNNRLEVEYLSVRPPSVITARGEGNSDFHETQARTWLPTLGAVPIEIQVIPKHVERRLDLPEYVCLSGTRADSAESFSIDSHWVTDAPKSHPGCDEGGVEFEVPKGTNLASGLPVSPKLKRISFAWQAHPAFECRAESGGPELAVEPMAGALSCSPQREANSTRYVWSNCTYDGSLPAQLRFSLSCGPGKNASWTSTLRHSGQVLSGYLPPAERAVLVYWDGWCDAGRKDLEADSIDSVELLDSDARRFNLVIPACDQSHVVRQLIPNASPGQGLTVVVRGDRAFKPIDTTIGQCKHTDPTTSKTYTAGNCVSIAPPDKSARLDLVTVGTHVGLGLAFVEPRPLDSVAVLDDARDQFYSPSAELGLHVLWRGTETGFFRHLDLELGAALAIQRWKSYHQTVGQETSASRQEAAPLLMALLEPAVRVTYTYPWFAGAFVLGGWGGPAERAIVSSTPDHLVLGAGLELGYSWTRTLSLAVRPRLAVARMRVTAQDAGGIAESYGRHPAWLIDVPLVVRFEDLTGR